MISATLALETCNQSYEETLAVQRKDFLFRAKCEKIEKLYWESFHHYQGKHQSPSSMNVEVTISESISDEGAWIYHNVLGRSYLTNIIPNIYHRQYMYRTEHLCAQTLNTLKITQNINHMPYATQIHIFWAVRHLRTAIWGGGQVKQWEGEPEPKVVFA